MAIGFVGFVRNISITTSFQVKLWAFQDGLSLCVDKNFDAVEVEIDAKSVMDILSSLIYTNNLLSPLVDDCRLLATLIPQIQLKHYYCEANRSTDKLARLGAIQDSCFELFVCPPMDVFGIFNFELNGFYLNKVCLETLFSS